MMAVSQLHQFFFIDILQFNMITQVCFIKIKGNGNIFFKQLCIFKCF